MEKDSRINQEFDVPCKWCGHPRNLLTKIKDDGCWFMCLNKNTDCRMFFVRKDVDTINAVLEVAMKYATCTKKSIGAVLSLNNVIISLGYNGPPKSFERYCLPCPRLNAPSGTDMDKCPAVHAEMRSILSAHRDVRGATMYITCGLPCKDCMKEIIEAGIIKIVSPYPLNMGDTEYRGDGFKSGEAYNFNLAYEMMKAAGIEYVQDERLIKGATAHVSIKEIK
jgi:dCMP deaminase